MEYYFQKNPLAILQAIADNVDSLLLELEQESAAMMKRAAIGSSYQAKINEIIAITSRLYEIAGLKHDPTPMTVDQLRGWLISERNIASSFNEDVIQVYNSTWEVIANEIQGGNLTYSAVLTKARQSTTIIVRDAAIAITAMNDKYFKDTPLTLTQYKSNGLFDFASEIDVRVTDALKRVLKFLSKISPHAMIEENSTLIHFPHTDVGMPPCFTNFGVNSGAAVLDMDITNAEHFFVVGNGNLQVVNIVSGNNNIKTVTITVDGTNYLANNQGLCWFDWSSHIDGAWTASIPANLEQENVAGGSGTVYWKIVPGLQTLTWASAVNCTNSGLNISWISWPLPRCVVDAVGRSYLVATPNTSKADVVAMMAGTEYNDLFNRMSLTMTNNENGLMRYLLMITQAIQGDWNIFYQIMLYLGRLTNPGKYSRILTGWPAETSAYLRTPLNFFIYNGNVNNLAITYSRLISELAYDCMLLLSRYDQDAVFRETVRRYFEYI